MGYTAFITAPFKWILRGLKNFLKGVLISIALKVEFIRTMNKGIQKISNETEKMTEV